MRDFEFAITNIKYQMGNLKCGACGFFTQFQKGTFYIFPKRGLRRCAPENTRGNPGYVFEQISNYPPGMVGNMKQLFTFNYACLIIEFKLGGNIIIDGYYGIYVHAFMSNSLFLRYSDLRRYAFTSMCTYLNLHLLKFALA